MTRNSRSAAPELSLVGGFILILLLVMTLTVKANASSARGAAIGVGLGLINLGLGLVLARRMLRKGITSAMTVLMAGFFLRMLVLVAVFLGLERTTTVDPKAFGLTFLVFFFVYLGAELVLVKRARGQHARPAASPAPQAPSPQSEVVA